MTASNTASHELSVTDTDIPPVADVSIAGVASKTALPRPLSSQPDIADSGRIRFGAGYRLPLSK